MNDNRKNKIEDKGQVSINQRSVLLIAECVGDRKKHKQAVFTLPLILQSIVYH